MARDLELDGTPLVQAAPIAVDKPGKKEESLVDDTLSDGLDGLAGLAGDGFALTEDDVVVESLTGTHGMTEIAASCSCWSGTGSCISA